MLRQLASQLVYCLVLRLCPENWARSKPKTQPTYLSAYLFKSDCRHEPGPEFQKLRSESHRPLGVPIFIPPSKLRGNFMPFVQMLGSRLCPEDTAPTRACPLSFGLNLHYAPLQPRLR